MSVTPSPEAALQRTPLYELHVSLGAKMVPFAGYEMPVQYPLGILKEHLHTRDKAGLFDVSHMGQAFLIGPDHTTTAAALEALVPADIVNLEAGRQRYTQLMNDDGGIIDDLMVTRSGDTAGRRQPDAGGQCIAQGGRFRPHRRTLAGRCAAAAGAGARAACSAGAVGQACHGEGVAMLRLACHSWLPPAVGSAT